IGQGLGGGPPGRVHLRVGERDGRLGDGPPRRVRDPPRRPLRGGVPRRLGLARGALRVPPDPHRALPRVVLPLAPREEGGAESTRLHADGDQLPTGLLHPALLLQLLRIPGFRLPPVRLSGGPVWVRAGLRRLQSVWRVCCPDPAPPPPPPASPPPPPPPPP